MVDFLEDGIPFKKLKVFLNRKIKRYNKAYMMMKVFQGNLILLNKLCLKCKS